MRVCLDTAHAFVAGYDLSTDGGARSVAEELQSAVGPALALLHLNDAKYGLGSHRDGHSKIGEGEILNGAWKGLFGGLPGIPAIMETPYSSPEADEREVQLVKKLAGGLPVSPGEV
jgi:deoxyribonuclease-4